MDVALVISLVLPLQEPDTQLDSHVAAESMRSVRQKQLLSGLLSTGMLQPRAVSRA